MKNWRVWLRLGRISNLPTVISNVLAGTVLAGGELDTDILPVLFAVILFYEAGMLLNDALDRHVDALERPERPIPSGQVTAAQVFIIGFALLAFGWITLWRISAATAWVGTLLLILIVAYDSHHKGVAWSPLLMGGCRGLLYLLAGVAAGSKIEPQLFWAAFGLSAYVAGLTFAAKQENLLAFQSAWPLYLLAAPLPCMLAWQNPASWAFLLFFMAWTIWMLGFLVLHERRNTRKAVSGLIAGIALLDAVFAAESGSVIIALAAVAAFLITLLWQLRIAGT